MNKIFNENCLETMQRPELAGKVDLVITSPPYNTSRVGASDKYNSRYDTSEEQTSQLPTVLFGRNRTHCLITEAKTN